MIGQDTRIGAISTFLQRLDKLGRVDGKQLYFRGHSKASYQLKPTVYRNRGWIQSEAEMLKELILRCPNDFAGGISTFQSLVRMQHYGLPTRLLDLTSNPLVALYFACEMHRDDDEDAEVIVLRFGVDEVKYFDSDTVSLIANLSRRPAGFVVPDIADIQAFNKDDAIKLLLHDVRQDRPHFEPEIQRDHLGSVVCVRPRLENPRIIRQEGAFLLFGCDGQKFRPAALPDESVVARLVINRNEKKDLSDRLQTLGISRATMFPEIDQVSTYLRDINFVPKVQVSKLSAPQRRVFQVLRQAAELSVSEIAAKTGLSAPTASQAVSQLNDQRFVETVGSGRERRWRVALTLDVAEGSDNSAANEGA
jgi:DNA-binding transcriptional ArsR family regulator